nr:hypothetical protein GCM10020093_030020 [Planobispora longispora]
MRRGGRGQRRRGHQRPLPQPGAADRRRGRCAVRRQRHPELFERVRDGDLVRLHEGVVYLGDEIIGKGEAQTAESVGAAMAEARAGLAVQIEAFALNTMEYVRRESDLLIDGVGVPDISTSMEGRHVLIVVRGYHYKEDIAALRPYIREYRPVMIGVDGGADALLEAATRPM